MIKRMTARVAVDKTNIQFDTLFSYQIPDELVDDVKKGCRVIVPFGNGNRRQQGMVFAVDPPKEGDENLKPILSVLDAEPLLSDEMLRVAVYMTDHTFCTYYDAVRAILPTGINYHIIPTYSLAVELSEVDFPSLDEDQARLVDFLRFAQTEADVNQFLEIAQNPSKKRVVDSLLERGIIRKNDDIKRRVQDQTMRMVRAVPSFDQSAVKLTAKQREVLDFLNEAQSASVKEICYACGVTEVVIKNLAKHDAVEFYERETYRTPYDTMPPSAPEQIALSPSQQEVFDGIEKLYDAHEPAVALLHGVTGSGKTQVFLKLIERALADGKQAVMLVPEISLTPQTVAKFQQMFGSRIAVLHSGLSLGERLDEWKRIGRGDAQIAVGTRSAIFAPFQDLGLIIMDEEGEFSYKSESAPRYHARDIAKFRCVYHKCPLLLASATPSIDSYYQAKSGKYHLFELHERYSNAVLPNVHIVDLRNAEKSNYPSFSQELIDELHYNLERGEQSILLLNRRGYNTFASCIDCGAVVECPNCSVAMTYHKANGYMMCHYCGAAIRPPEICPSCGSAHMKLSGVGTQRIEDEMSLLFPDARILRMDADTTGSRYAYEESFRRFAGGEYDIMIGTQMIAKGLDFPNVTLVGVLSADQSLYSNDFRSSERTFALITQVVGRSGRGDKPGRAFIQTYTPEHPVINFAARQDYAAFYHDESAMRKSLLYPPFCDICLVGFSGSVEKTVSMAADRFLDILSKLARESKHKLAMKVLGPTQFSVLRVNKKYRYRLVIKCRANRAFRSLIRAVIREMGKEHSFHQVSIFADINGDINV